MRTPEVPVLLIGYGSPPLSTVEVSLGVDGECKLIEQSQYGESAVKKKVVETRTVKVPWAVEEKLLKPAR